MNSIKVTLYLILQGLVEKTEGKQFSKRDTLREIEKKIQEKWENEKIFEIDAPKVLKKIAALIILLLSKIHNRKMILEKDLLTQTNIL